KLNKMSERDGCAPREPDESVSASKMRDLVPHGARATAHLKNEMRSKSTQEPSSTSPENMAKALARSPSWAGAAEAAEVMRYVLVQVARATIPDRVPVLSVSVRRNAGGSGMLRSRLRRRAPRAELRRAELSLHITDPWSAAAGLQLDDISREGLTIFQRTNFTELNALGSRSQHLEALLILGAAMHDHDIL